MLVHDKVNNKIPEWISKRQPHNGESDRLRNGISPVEAHNYLNYAVRYPRYRKWHNYCQVYFQGFPLTNTAVGAYRDVAFRKFSKMIVIIGDVLVIAGTISF